MQSASSSLKTKAIRAGAGAGKTYNLTREVITQALTFFAREQRWPRFVVTTFTKKATQELSERLMILCLQEYPQAMDFISSSGALKVSTIHGVLDEFLKDLGHLIDLKSDFSYLTESEALFLSKKVLKEIVEEERPEVRELFGAFSFFQLHGLLRESSRRELEGYQPLDFETSQAMLQEFLASVQKQVRGLLAAVSQYELPEQWKITTAQLARIEGYLTVKEWKKSEEAIALIDQFDLRKGLKLKSHPDSAIAYDVLKPVVEELRELDHPAYQLKTIENLARYNDLFANLQKVYLERFKAAKKQMSRIEMGDLELFAFEIAQNYNQPVKQWSLKKDYWFVDEFQDTSPLQMSILRELIGTRSYYLVGDPQQSIYLFRGARSEVFLEQFKKVEANNGEIHLLDQNYRSTPSLLGFINRWVADREDDFSPMIPALEPVTNKQADVTCFVSESPEDEFKFLLQSVRSLQTQGISLEKIAILVRRNRDLEDVGQFLSQNSLPVHLHSSGLFWQRREVLSALSLFKFLVRPYDNENLITLLRCPVISITDQQLVDGVQGAMETSLWQALKHTHRDVGAVQSLQQALAMEQTHGLVHAFEVTLKSLGFFDHHLEIDPTGRSEGNLWKLVNLLKNFERERGASFTQFINDCERAVLYESSVDSPGSIEKNKINVMTVHASKGLQFEYVFLPLLSIKPYRENQLSFAVDEKHNIWSIRAPADESETKSSASMFERSVLKETHGRQDQEDLRVLYVAITRAKQRLYLSWSTPVAKNSWAQSFQFLLEAEKETSYKVEFAKLVEAEQPGIFSKTVPAEIRAPYQTILWDEFKIQSQAVTKMVSQQQKSYKAAYIKKQQGILFHKLVEIIKYPVPKNIPLLLETWFGSQQEDVLQALNYILALQEPPLVQLMKAGKVEWAFRYKKEEQTFDGQVDLWAIYEDTLWIIDYKSGERILLDKAFAQLQVYAEAIVSYLDWKGPVRASVVYPFLETSVMRKL